MTVLGTGTDEQTFTLARTSVPVRDLGFVGAESADLTGDGIVDSRDIREFAKRHDLPLLPEFSQKLDRLDARRLRPKNRGPR